MMTYGLRPPDRRRIRYPGQMRVLTWSMGVTSARIGYHLYPWQKEFLLKSVTKLNPPQPEVEHEETA